MLWFFNRKEVYTGFSLSDFARVRDTLAANGIRYETKVVDMSGRGRGVRSALFATERYSSSTGYTSYSKQYYVYVHKNDCDRAVHLLSR